MTFRTLIELKQCGILRYAPEHIRDIEDVDPLPEIEPALFMSAALKIRAFRATTTSAHSPSH